MESHLRVEIVPRPDGPGYAARINGASFPLTDFAVQYDPESGTPMLSLILVPDSLSIGEPSTSAAPPVTDTTAKLSTWGDGSLPDPREAIPGWQPEGIGDQVAGHAERVAFAEESMRSRMQRLGLDGRCDLRTVSEAFRRLILGGEGGSVAVTA